MARRPKTDVLSLPLPAERSRTAGARRVPPGYIHTSAAYTVKKGRVRAYTFLDRRPELGDVAYGRIVRLGFHSGLENKSGRIHMVNDGSRALFVFGNRYAPDHYEGLVPDRAVAEVDLLARSGVVGLVRSKNSVVKDPTRVQILGYVTDPDGKVLNTRDMPMIVPSTAARPGRPRAKMILVVGTSMNSGKSMTAVACCWALSTQGYSVRASKITGTASLKDILHMNDAGASVYNDFTHFGYPATYMLDEDELLRIFRDTDLKYANNPRNFWVVELADGVLQRETAMLLASPEVKARIHRLIFCAGDALGCVGGIEVLKEKFNLQPDAISGIVSSSPLARAELQAFSSIPVFDNLERNLEQISAILI
jgi:hypothetical protein